MQIHVARTAYQTGLVGFLVIVDALFKYWVQRHIPFISVSPSSYPYGGVGIFHDFWGMSLSINYTTNTGAAWGLFADWGDLLFGMRVVIILGLIVYVIVKSEKSFCFPLLLIISGALGNVIDYGIYGYVVDMIKVVFGSYHYPIFNLADSYIVIGVILLVLLEMFKSKKSVSL